MSYGGSEREEDRETSNKGKKEIYMYISQRRNEDGFSEAKRYSVVAVRTDMYDQTDQFCRLFHYTVDTTGWCIMHYIGIDTGFHFRFGQISETN
jgi:hypothetical protein